MSPAATIYYFSGTGNSLWTAQQIAKELSGARIVPMTAPVDGGDAGVLGFVFPVHMWGLPRRVIEFVDNLKIDPSTYCFAVAVNAGQVSRTLVQLRNRLARRGLSLSLGRSVVLPSNYIPWGGPGSDESIREKIRSAQTTIREVVRAVRDRETAAMDQGPLWQRILFTAIYRMSFSHVSTMDRKFFSEDSCTGCGVCVKICPAKNIRLADGRPVWGGHCEQCLACLQWCPEQAIQYGPKTKAYKRYHHPEVTLSMMTAAPD